MRNKIVRPKIERLLKESATDARVLDVGASSERYRHLFPNKISIDIDAKTKPDVVGDAHHLPFEDGAFPMTICIEVLEHVEDPRRVIEELKRTLAPGGKMILTTRFMYPLHEAPRDNWRFTQFLLADLFSDWEDVSILPDTQVFETFAALIQRVVFQTRFAHMDKPLKLLLVGIGWFLWQFDRFAYTTFGNINKTVVQEHIFTTGYFVIARKKKVV